VVGVDQANPPVNTHADAQLFSPPYLFKGPRPGITRAPTAVAYGASFDVETPEADAIGQVTWIRLPSVTHSFDQNQRINVLPFARGAAKISVTAPPDANACPPGHYMLFLLNRAKVPSVAAIVQIAAAPAAAARATETTAAGARPAAAGAAAAVPVQFMTRPARQPGPLELDAAIRARETRPAVVVGVTPTCPYGLSACWGGAYEALSRLRGVRLVRPVPNAQDSTAFVYLAHGGLPDLDVWHAQFAQVANGTHLLRGVEVTLEGEVATQGADTLVLHGHDVRPPVYLRPMQAEDKVQWDPTTAAVRPLEPAEADAYALLLRSVTHAGGSLRVGVTGPLQKSEHGMVLEVRQFSQ
jgi:hypothetical protein